MVTGVTAVSWEWRRLVGVVAGAAKAYLDAALRRGGVCCEGRVGSARDVSGQRACNDPVMDSVREMSCNGSGMHRMRPVDTAGASILGRRNGFIAVAIDIVGQSADDNILGSD
jgi:hypothetical protein